LYETKAQIRNRATDEEERSEGNERLDYEAGHWVIWEYLGEEISEGNERGKNI
jgi:hypothetical protein